ncbi:hypothetical protein BH23ACT6_BH23ACT6_20660 [soil metagenome]
MAQNKTQPTATDPADFIAGVDLAVLEEIVVKGVTHMQANDDTSD